MLTSNSELIDSIEITVIGAEKGLNMNDSNEIIVLIAIKTIIALIATEITAASTAIATKSASFIRSQNIN